MKTITIRSFIVASLFLLMQPSHAFSAAFTKGNLVVSRVANATAGWQSVYLDEYTPSGTLVQTVALPATASGSNRPIGIDCQNSPDGTLNLSGDKRYLLMGGYKTGLASVLASSGNTRIVATVANDATINTTTELSDIGAQNWGFRSVVSTNGTNLWLSGTFGIYYTTLGGSTSTNLFSAVGPNNQGIYDNKLYLASATATNYFGILNNGLPTSGGSQPNTVLGSNALPTNIGIVYPLSFVMFDMDASIPGVDVMYMAENATAGGSTVNASRGLMKYCLNSSGLWVKKGAIIPAPIAANGLKGLTGVCNAATGGVTLYATTVTYPLSEQTSIVTLTDNSGYNGALAGTLTNIVTSDAGTAFRGIVFAPEAASTVPDAPVSVAATAGSAQVSVAFSTPNNTGGSDITGYTVTPYIAGVAQTPVSGTSSPIAVTGLTNGTAYTFTVIATNSVGNSVASVATAAATPVAGLFTKGNLVVARVANATAGWQSVYLDEYSPKGTLVQTLALPDATASLPNRPIGIDCQSSNDGTLNLSADKSYLLMGGYKNGISSVLSTSPTFNTRIVARVDNYGAINTTTELSNIGTTALGFKSVVSTNGTDFWLSGQFGINYTTLGASSSINLTATTLNPINQGIYDNKLYFSSTATANLFGSLNNGLPTSGGSQAYTVLGSTTAPTNIGIVYPLSFVMFDMNASIAGVDVMYVAENATLTGGGSANASRGLMKYCLNSSGLWVKKGAIIQTPIAANGLKGLTGVYNAATGAVTLYATTITYPASEQTAIVTLTDNSGYNGSLAGTFTTLATSAAGTAFRGIAFTPVATVPAAPTSVVATADNSQASVAFSMADDRGSAITGYTVTPYIGAVAGTPVSGTGSPIVVTGLTNGTAYTFKVYATNGVGKGAVSTASAAVTPFGTTAVNEVSEKANLSIAVYNGKIQFTAVQGEKLEVYNTIGQKLVSKVTVDGVNEITLASKAVVIVKVGNRITKVTL